MRAARRIRLLLLRRAEEPMSPAQFRREADPLLANCAGDASREYMAVWIEDEQGQVIASSGPANLIAAFSGAKRSTENPDGGLAIPPRRVDGAFGIAAFGRGAGC